MRYLIVAVRDDELDFDGFSEALNDVPIESITLADESYAGVLIDKDGDLWVEADPGQYWSTLRTNDLTRSLEDVVKHFGPIKRAAWY